MYKHIKIKGEVIGEDKIKLTVLSVTHEGNSFGEYARRELGVLEACSYSFTRGSIRIASDAGGVYLSEFIPGWVGIHGQTHTLYIGRSQAHRKEGCVVSFKEWSAIKATVKAYNEYFKE